jgi:capsular polysaccharide transport system permease protein
MNEMPYRVLIAPRTGVQALIGQAASVRANRIWGAIWALLIDRRLQFLVIVILPTLLSGFYFGLIASKRYVSHAEYIVRGVTANRSGGLGVLLTTFGISRTADDASAIESFIRSRDAVQQLDERLNLREIYNRPGTDFLSRYRRFFEKDTFETLYYRVRNYMSVVDDPTTGITILEVSAFRPDDAQLIAKTLVTLAEEMVNRMNERVEDDTVSEAEKEVARARQEVLETQANLTTFRNKEFLVDPVSFAAVLLEAISQLSFDKAQTQAQIRGTLALSPDNPSIAALRAKADALDNRIVEERKGLAGNDAAMAEKVSTYEQLTLMRTLADKRYGNALLALQAAQQEAQRQQIYIEEMIVPNLPDEDTEPERLRLVLTVFVLSFAVFSVLWIMMVGAKDHAQ